MHTNVILTNNRRIEQKLSLGASYTPSGQEKEWAYSTPQDPHGGPIWTTLMFRLWRKRNDAE